MRFFLAISLTVILSVTSIFIILSQIDVATISAYGSFIGGIATAIAIIWIVYNAFLQRKSLDYQQKELALQRLANEKAAAANSLDAFLRLLDHAVKSISMDTQNIVKRYYANSSSNMAEFSALESSFISGNVEAYFSFISSNSEFASWLADSIANKSSLSLSAQCEEIVRKYETLLSQMKTLRDNKDIYEILVLSSPMSHAIRVIRNISSQ